VEVTREDVIALLKAHGAEPKRKNKHEVWGLPDGRSVTLPVSPSCRNAWMNQYHDVRRLLGLTPTEQRVGERRERRKRQRSIQPRWKGFQPAVIAKRTNLKDLLSTLPTTGIRSDASGHSRKETIWVSPTTAILNGLLKRMSSHA
jgi:hypothetical protein